MFIISITYRTIINLSDFGLAEYSLLIMTTMQVGFIVCQRLKAKENFPENVMVKNSISF